jgi:putative ABC transport system permease protein
MTLAGIAVAIVAFTIVRTVVTSWNSAIDHAAKDRISTRHKVTFVMTLPKRYVEDIRQVPGVSAATWANWFGGKNPNAENEFFATIAVDVPSFIDVYKEISIEPAAVEAWRTNRRGALIGEVLAKKFGWKPGDKVTLEGTIFPGKWEFEISGIYKATQRSVDRSTFWFHWDYLNDSPQMRRKDEVGWIVSRVDSPGKSAEISRRIDKMFDERDVQTLTMSEKALQQSFLGMLSAMLKALDLVGAVILVIMMLIVANTIAMGVRERTNEYGMMRAIGFRPRHIAGFVVGESIVIALVGGLVGVGLSYPLIDQGLGRYLEENMAAAFPFFRVAPVTVITALIAAAGLGALAASLPAWKAARLNIVESIRKIG